MTYPASDVPTTDMDAGTDSPAIARASIFDLATKFNLLRNHISTFMQGLLSSADASSARATLNAAAAGANPDITSLTALTAGGLPDSSVTTPDIAAAAVTPAKLSQPFTRGTSQATTSGTSFNRGGIPSWASVVFVTISKVSANGSGIPLLRFGDSGGIENTGYASSVSNLGAGGGPNTDGFFLAGSSAAANVISGVYTFVKTDPATNEWVGSGTMGYSNAASTAVCGGSKSLTTDLTQIELTTSTGTDTFDGGSWNVSWF